MSKETIEFEDGWRKVYTGELKDDKRHGNGKMVWENGAKYSGEWKNDKMDGLGKYTFSDGKIPKEHIG